MPYNQNFTRKSRRQNIDEEELVLKCLGQEYAQITKSLGGGRFLGYCFDGKERLLVVRGKLLKKSVWITLGDIVLITLREFQDDKADIERKYSLDQIRMLKKTESFQLPEDHLNLNEEVNFE